MWIDWRPIVGCSPISAGCANCAGMKAAPPALTRASRAGQVWNGKLRLDRAALDLPLAITAPSVVSVCANGDLFHQGAPDAWLDLVFDRIDASQHHTGFQILTKRSARMLDYTAWRYPGGLPAKVHLGVSAERQAEADRRLADLVATPSAIRFAHFYPLLGRIDCARFLERIDYVVAGEEPERPALPEWFDDLRRQCAEAGIPFEASNQIAP